MTVTALLKQLLSKIPAPVRLVLYVVAFLALLGWSAWSAADGDWATAIPKFLSSLISALAAGNVDLGALGDDGSED